MDGQTESDGPTASSDNRVRNAPLLVSGGPSISVQVVTRGEAHTGAVLASIRAQLAPGDELIVVTAVNSPETRASEERSLEKVLEVAPTLRLLHAREFGLRAASAQYSLLLDSTRRLLPGALATLRRMASEFDSVAIREDSVGKGFFARSAALDKQIIQSKQDFRAAALESRGYVLPRLFETTALRETFDALRSNLGKQLFEEVRYGDHHLIAIEFMRTKSRIGFTELPLIEHFEDESLRQIITKYSAYGKSQRLLSAVRTYPQVRDLTDHKRSLAGVPIADRLRVLALYGLRAGSFLSGYFVGDIFRGDPQYHPRS